MGLQSLGFYPALEEVVISLKAHHSFQFKVAFDLAPASHLRKLTILGS